jgi:hypothetical protein
MRLKVQPSQTGYGHPSEVLVTVRTTEGQEQLVVHERSIKNDTVEIGYPIHSRDSEHLVELPRETVNGAWRIWVPSDSVL